MVNLGLLLGECRTVRLFLGWHHPSFQKRSHEGHTQHHHRNCFALCEDCMECSARLRLPAERGVHSYGPEEQSPREHESVRSGHRCWKAFERRIRAQTTFPSAALLLLGTRSDPMCHSRRSVSSNPKCIWSGNDLYLWRTCSRLAGPRFENHAAYVCGVVFTARVSGPFVGMSPSAYQLTFGINCHLHWVPVLRKDDECRNLRFNRCLFER